MGSAVRRFLNLLETRRRRLERDLDGELRDHLERRVADLRQAGLAEDDARRRAAIELGGVEQGREDVRATWGSSAIVVVYPALWSRDFLPEARDEHAHDAYVVAEWMRRADAEGSMDP